MACGRHRTSPRLTPTRTRKPNANDYRGAYAGTAGIDCSGYVYAAAGYSSGAWPTLKKATSELRQPQGTEFAGWEAGPVDNLQPMNYFVANNNSHTFYYEYRYIDGSGISTLEATTEPANGMQGAKQYNRNLRVFFLHPTDPNGWQHRSWWQYNPGESYVSAVTTRGSSAACMGVKGENPLV
jgi:hypothetical protein